MSKKGYKQTKEHKKNLSLAHTGKKHSHKHLVNLGRAISIALKKSYREGNRIHWNLGKHTSEETRKKTSETMKIVHREGRHPNYKGGITEINNKIRSSLEYRLWRESVFRRDNWTCVWCGARNGNGKTIILNADHIKRFADYPELRFAIDNGRTLCIDCHKTTYSKLIVLSK